MRATLPIAFVLLGTASAVAAEEPSGCDKFKWPIERERAALTAPDRVKLASGGELGAPPATGMTLALLTPAEAKLPNAAGTRAEGRHLCRLRQLQGRAEDRPLHHQPVGGCLGRCHPGRTRPEAQGL